MTLQRSQNVASFLVSGNRLEQPKIEPESPRPSSLEELRSHHGDGMVS